METAPIFIIGTERSGTNLLRVMLDSHSNIFIPNAPQIFKNFVGLLPRYGDLNNDENFYRLIKDIIKLIKLHPYKWEISYDPDEVFKQVKQRSLISLLFYFYDKYADQNNKQRFGCKNAFMMHYVNDIIKYCPQAKFLYLVRDGRDVAVSAKKSIFNHFSVYYIAKLWQTEQQLCISFLEGLAEEQICLIRYEDLLTAPQATLERVCIFLKENFEPKMLEYFFSKEAQKGRSLGQAWYNLATPILEKNYNKYINELSSKDILLFESIAFKELQYFDYAIINKKEQFKDKDYIAKRKIFYFCTEKFLWLKTQLFALFKNKDNFLRLKKYLFVLSRKWL